MERLQAEYNEMDVERKENDLHLAELRKEADEIEEKVSTLAHVQYNADNFTLRIDVRTLEG